MMREEAWRCVAVEGCRETCRRSRDVSERQNPRRDAASDLQFWNRHAPIRTQSMVCETWLVTDFNLWHPTSSPSATNIYRKQPTAGSQQPTQFGRLCPRQLPTSLAASTRNRGDRYSETEVVNTNSTRASGSDCKAAESGKRVSYDAVRLWCSRDSRLAGLDAGVHTARQTYVTACSIIPPVASRHWHACHSVD